MKWKLTPALHLSICFIYLYCKIFTRFFSGFDIPNVAKMPGQIYINSVKNANDCQCRNIVLPSIPELTSDNYPIMQLHVCPTCKCIYQRRNLTIISYVVIFICVLIGLFVSYIFISQLIWPRFLISLSYKEQRDDDIAMEEVEPKPQREEREVFEQNSNSRFSALNFIRNQQSKWQRDLHQQQRNIYQDHSMLN